ncbi:hypothetical protein QTN25_007935 [Entamoeba marina]
MKTLDSYSLLIVSKYFWKKRDYLNIICVCKKFKDTTEKLRYNPISIQSMNLFPKIQTQYLYSRKDKKMTSVEKYEIWYYVNYDEFLSMNKSNIKCRHIRYNLNNRFESNNYLIPIDVDFLCERCFYNANVDSISIPTKVTFIGNRCFCNCFNLKNIELPKFLNSINYNCFESCTSLTSITIPESITVLAEYLFSRCHSLVNVKLPKSLISIGNYCFSNCSNFRTIILPPLLEHIGDGCFIYCNIISIEIPESIKTIGVRCFCNCSALTSITTKSNMKEFTFPVSYGDYLLYNQFNIKCPNIIINRNDAAFFVIEAQQNKLTSIHIPNGIVELIDNSFSHQRFRSIVLPTTITSLGNYCFSDCISLTSINLPSSLVSIGSYCFIDCKSLSSITIPTTLTKLGLGCFKLCPLLKGVINVPQSCF